MNVVPLRRLVRVAPSPIHGRGVFALRAIARGSFIGEYGGRSTRRDGTYVLWVGDDDASEARVGVPPLKYLNHSKQPNAEFDGFDLYALTDIAAGEEITFDYGDDWP